MRLTSGWVLYALAVFVVLYNEYRAWQVRRGLMLLILPGPATVLAILSGLAQAAPWPAVLLVAILDFGAYVIRYRW